MPPSPVLIALLLLPVLPPFVAQARGSTIGSYTKFHRLSLHHLDLHAVFGVEERRVELRELSPHLSPEARVILMPAGGRAIGADQIDVAAASLPDLAWLVCALRPGAKRARARLSQDPFDAYSRSDFTPGFRRECPGTASARRWPSCSSRSCLDEPSIPPQRGLTDASPWRKLTARSALAHRSQ